MRYIHLPLLATVFFAAQADAAQVCRYQNFMPDFFAFEAKTATLSPDERTDRFVSDFMPRHPTFYSADLFQQLAKAGTTKKYARGLFDSAKPEEMPGFPTLDQNRFRAVAGTIETDFAASQTKLLATFPDFKCETEIEFGPSFLAFDGHGFDDDQKKSHLLFGVDTISLLHGPSDMSAFFTHELFHVYHAQVMGKRTPENSVVWWSLWEEGLATYISKALNEPQTEQIVLGFPTDLVAQMEKPGIEQRAAQQMLKAFDDSENYAQWFEGMTPKNGLPPRSGYYMGLKMIEELARDHSPQELAHMSPEDIKPRVKAFLEKQAAAQ